MVVDARVNPQHGWARLASSVLFLLWTYFTYESISGVDSVVGLINFIVELVVWGFGGAAIYQLWLPGVEPVHQVQQGRQLPLSHSDVTVAQLRRGHRKPACDLRRHSYRGPALAGCRASQI